MNTSFLPKITDAILKNVLNELDHMDPGKYLDLIATEMERNDPLLANTLLQVSSKLRDRESAIKAGLLIWKLVKSQAEEDFLAKNLKSG
jgi:hypothetical protein